MEFLNHEWRMTMQLSSSSSSVKLFHWANMTKLTPGGTPSAPVLPSAGSLWPGGGVVGARGVIRGCAGPGGGFEIDGFRKGFFQGRGIGQSNFNVFASVTPEGSLLLLLISPDGTVSRTGTLKRMGRLGLMQFRSYQGDTGLGVALCFNTDAV